MYILLLSHESLLLREKVTGTALNNYLQLKNRKEVSKGIHYVSRLELCSFLGLILLDVSIMTLY